MLGKRNRSKHLLVSRVLKERVVALRGFADAHCSLLLHTLEVDLVRVEEGVRSVDHINVAAALLLKRLLGQKAEVAWHPTAVPSWRSLDGDRLQRVLS